MRKWKLLLLSLLILTYGPLSASSETIKIGVAGPFTGNAAAYGVKIRQGTTLKAKEINEAGGINGAKLKLVFGDDAADPKEAAAVASKFASNKSIVAVVGHFNSSCSLAARPIYKMYGVVEFSPGSTNPTVAEGSPWTFRNIYRDDVQGPALARYAKEVLGYKKGMVFHDNDDYGIGLKNSFVKEAKIIGMEIVGVEAYTRDSVDFTPQLSKVRSYDPDFIFISGLYNEGALIASQARKLGLDTPLLGADGFLSEDLIKIGGKAVEGVILSTPIVFTEGDPFSKKFKEAYGVLPDCWAGLSYDAVGMIAQAIEEVGPDRKAIRDYLASITSEDKAYPGVTGLTYFDENGDSKKPIFFATVKNGRFVPADVQIEQPPPGGEPVEGR